MPESPANVGAVTRKLTDAADFTFFAFAVCFTLIV